ncbi:ubiquitin carboxyl-terminal hydrolase 35 isoform X2 [Plutella xylostella]|nr:ubiquitin carboxyl-terminal hydrolase 35 isoform X1 [Plutella xylostella]XP_048488737.1 ubiquitin carboxyl-terminal hydrolase 35 isoform X2 [Plutella xylostella]
MLALSSATMAVKKHELAPDSRNQLDLATLAQYIQMLDNQPFYLPDTPDITKHCQDIVKCLARTSIGGNGVELWEQLHLVEAFFISLLQSMPVAARREIVSAVLEKFHSLISDPQSDACPAMSVVLIVFDGAESEDMMKAARWLMERDENGPAAGAGLRACLSCFYRWTYQWDGTPALGDWIMTFIKVLEEKEHFDILIEVSIDNIERMVLALRKSVDMKRSVAAVILHVLACMRDSTDALDRIAPHVDTILVALASQCGQWSRQLLQNVVDILAAYIDALPVRTNPRIADKYASVMLCLEKHMASRGCPYLAYPSWSSQAQPGTSGAPSVPSAPPTRKVGLLNLGNTCYMNSVMQALLATRQFSSHVVLRMHAVPYWQLVGGLFAKMIHSISTKLNPEDIFHAVKPPFFTLDHQHDSSEFLGYLFELLHTYEHVSDVNFDYSRPHAIHCGQLRSLPARPAAKPTTSKAEATRTRSSPSHDHDNNNEPGGRRSMSPRPGGSGVVTRAGGSGKRISPGRSPECLMPPKKRPRMHMVEPTFLRQNSFVDSLFGGVLLTRVECSQCQMSSLSRDVFRDLQLAFPEKPEPGKQHCVQSLLEFYCSKERMTGDNRYDCRDCGQLMEAERSVLIETPPKHLILVLKNFRFEAKRQSQTKLMHPMHYNSTITLPTVRSQTDHATYQLYAAVIHAGTTLDSGHYFTLAKDNDQWHMYNDDVVTPSDEGELNALTNCCTPYILFYRRTDVEDVPTPRMQEMPEKVQEIVMSHNKHFIESMRQLRGQRP